MKKTLLALAVTSLAASAAHAQSNVTIYGVLDIGYIKDTGRDLRMGDNDNNRIGFRGQEDLGGGLKAIFQLEQRFDLNDGTTGNTNTAGWKGTAKTATQKDWDGAALVGLAHANWGQVRFGRVNELTTETIRKYDPFNQIGVASQIYSLQRNARIDNTARYDSPNWSGFNFGLSYSLGNNTDSDSATAAQLGLKTAGADNDGYAASVGYDKGALGLRANWSRVADSNDSYTWNLGAAYKFANTVKVSLAYENTHSKGYKGGNSGTAASNSLIGNQQNWLLGLLWDVGPGQLGASVQYDRLKDAKYTGYDGSTKDTMKYAVGYTYFLSKRTSLYGQLAYTDYDDKATGKYFTGINDDSIVSVQLGITHKF